MKQKLRIGIDVDNVIADFSELFISEFNRLTNKNLSRKDLKIWNFKDAINNIYKGEINGEIANEILKDKSFFENLPLKEGALEGLRKLSENQDIDIVIVTALSKDMIPIRDLWIKNHLNEFKLEVKYETKKDNVKMNYLIDDGVHNLDMLNPIIGADNCLCIAEEYNQDASYNRFNSLYDAVNYIFDKENIA